MAIVAKDFRPQGLAGLHLPNDLVVKLPENEKEWVLRPAGHFYYPLMFDLAGGVTVNILKYPKGGIIGRHVHDGPVYSYTLQGSWGYLEHDWVANAGTFIWEPPGEMHTLNMYEDNTIALYIMHGGLVSLDENDNPIHSENCLSLLGYCDQYYRDNGFGEDYVKRFIR